MFEDREYYKKMGFPDPKRCKVCRERRKTVYGEYRRLNKLSRTLSINDSRALDLLKKSLGR
jgi:hypothetical protein